VCDKTLPTHIMESGKVHRRRCEQALILMDKTIAFDCGSRHPRHNSIFKKTAGSDSEFSHLWRSITLLSQLSRLRNRFKATPLLTEYFEALPMKLSSVIMIRCIQGVVSGVMIGMGIMSLVLAAYATLNASQVQTLDVWVFIAIMNGIILAAISLASAPRDAERVNSGQTTME